MRPLRALVFAGDKIFEAPEGMLYVQHDKDGGIDVAAWPGIFMAPRPMAVVVCEDPQSVRDTIDNWREKSKTNPPALDSFQKTLPKGAHWRGGGSSKIEVPKPTIHVA